MSLPQGFRYAAIYCGLRKVQKDDLALIVSDTPAVAAAVFTQNRVVAAPVVLARKNLAASRGKASAILVNAGNANCATRTGDQVASATVRATAKYRDRSSRTASGSRASDNGVNPTRSHPVGHRAASVRSYPAAGCPLLLPGDVVRANASAASR